MEAGALRTVMCGTASMHLLVLLSISWFPSNVPNKARCQQYGADIRSLAVKSWPVRSLRYTEHLTSRHVSDPWRRGEICHSGQGT